MIRWFGVAYAAALLVLTAVHAVAPQRSGVLALSQILAPHLFALAALFLPLAILPVQSPSPRPRSKAALQVALVAVAVVGAARFGPNMVSLPPPAPPASAQELSLLSWNLEFSGPTDDEIISILDDSGAQIVGLQELNRRDAATVLTDPRLLARFPYRELHPQDGSAGSGLLSSFPMLDSGWLPGPSTAWGRLDLGGGRSIVAATAHPPPGQLGPRVIFLPTVRDAAIRELRSQLVDPALAVGERVILFGDMNVTDREPAYRDLSAGLVDLHAEVGLGPGSTWRPSELEVLPFGIFRIDYVFVSRDLLPLAIAADCTPLGSDHCVLRARAAFPP